jgi:undecaprenyl-diphosphatase
MMEWLYGVDRAIFVFVNVTLGNSAGDVIWPVITDYDRLWPFRIVLIAAWLWLLIKGGKKGRTVALLVIPLVIISDQLSSSVLKQLFDRPRPCHTVDGVPIVPEVRLLMGCGSGKSFPSSHAVNNFAVATLFACYYRRWGWALYSWAFLVGLSRVAVGVHYPSDIVGGGVIGVILALALVWVWKIIESRFFTPTAPEVRKPLDA